MLPRISHIQIRVFDITNVCFQPDSLLVCWDSTPWALRKSLRRSICFMKENPLTNRSSIMYFVGKVTFLPQYPKPNPDAYPVITKLMFEENLL